MAKIILHTDEKPAWDLYAAHAFDGLLAAGNTTVNGPVAATLAKAAAEMADALIEERRKR